MMKTVFKTIQFETIWAAVTAKNTNVSNNLESNLSIDMVVFWKVS